MSDPKLKCCPFCGEQAEFTECDDDGDEIYAVACEGCDITLLTGTIGLGWFPSKSEAAEAWNTRHDN